jgi:sec-independent protein translocase protein TatA
MIELVAFGLGTTELLIILAILMFIFGASKLPELGKGLGTGIRGFQKGLKGAENLKNIETDDDNESAADKAIEDKSEPVKEVVGERVIEAKSEPIEPPQAKAEPAEDSKSAD